MGSYYDLVKAKFMSGTLRHRINSSVYLIFSRFLLGLIPRTKILHVVFKRNIPFLREITKFETRVNSRFCMGIPYFPEICHSNNGYFLEKSQKLYIG